MSLPLRLQTSDAFLGTQEGIHSIILPDLFSSGGSKNVWMDTFAQVRRILGYERANATGVTTNGGASATLTRALYPYRKTTGGVFTRQVIGAFDDTVNEFELHHSTDDGATWTFGVDLGAGSVGSIPCFMQFGDELYVTNGIVAPRMWNGTAWSVAGSTQLAAPTSVSAGTGRLTGNYIWKLVPVRDTGTRKIASVGSTVLSLESESATLGWAADADTSVAGYEIYRTSGTGKVFYYVDYVDGRTTIAYADNTEDAAILENRTMEEHGDAPPTGAYLCVAHKQRAWYWRTDALPRDGYYSDPGDPDSVWSENRVTLSSAQTQGDVVIAAEGDFEGMQVVFLSLSVFTISGDGRIINDVPNFSRTRTNAQAGAISARCVARVPAGAKYTDQEGQKQVTATVMLAYMTPLLDIRLFDGDNDIIISNPVKATLADLDFATRHKVHTLHDTLRKEITWFFPTGGGGEPDLAVVWNYRWGVWYPREWALACAMQMDSASQAYVHLGGSASVTDGGLVYSLWDTNMFDGEPFHAQWMTKTIYGQDDQGRPVLSFEKRWRWLDLLFAITNAAAVEVAWLEGNAPDLADANDSIIVRPTASQLLSADGSVILTFDGSPILVSASSAQVKVPLKTDGRYVHDLGVRLRIGDAAENEGDWALQAYVLAYQILPGLARRQFAART